MNPFGMDGTTYVPRQTIPMLIERYNYKGQAWRYRQRFSSYRPKANVIFKSIDKLNPADEEDFYRIMESAKAAGLGPPSSFTDIFLNVFGIKRPSFTPLAPFMGKTFGHWEWMLPGFRGTVYHYDLNKAFRWASMKGLPDFATAYETLSITEPCAIYVMDVPPGRVPYLHNPKRVVRSVVTSEERDAFGLHDTEVIAGIGFERMIDMAPIWARIDRLFPYCKDRISKSFWGGWNAKRFPECCAWRSGKLVARFLPNPFYNPVWSAFITSRVKLRIIPWLNEAVHIFADSVITRCQLPTSVEIGGWKEVGCYKDFHARWTGHYLDGDHVLKHSGVTVTARSMVTLRMPGVPQVVRAWDDEYEPGRYEWEGEHDTSAA